MDKESKLILKKKLDVTDLAGEKVMIDFESGKYFMLKGVANDIWDMLGQETKVGTIIEKLLAEYDVDEKKCEESVENFLTKLNQYDFIEIV